MNDYSDVFMEISHLSTFGFKKVLFRGQAVIASFSNTKSPNSKRKGVAHKDLVEVSTMTSVTTHMKSYVGSFSAISGSWKVAGFASTIGQAILHAHFPFGIPCKIVL